MLMPSVVQKNPGSQGCYPQGSSKCQAEVHRSDFLFPGATDDQCLHSLRKTVTLLQEIFMASAKMARFIQNGESECMSQSQENEQLTVQRCCVPSFKHTDLGYIYMR